MSRTPIGDLAAAIAQRHTAEHERSGFTGWFSECDDPICAALHAYRRTQTEARPNRYPASPDAS